MLSSSDFKTTAYMIAKEINMTSKNIKPLNERFYVWRGM